MTEQEARARWCPFVRDTDENHGSCIGSGCMAWRETRTDETKITNTFRGTTLEGGWRYSVPLEDGRYVYVRLSGYCGLAGTP